MANQPMSLARFIDSDVVFDNLGLPAPSSPVFPKVMPCPFCSGELMTVMEDTILHAEWYHCYGCKFAGDIIQLVMQQKSICVQEAICWLEQTSAIDAKCPSSVVEAYEPSHFQARKRVNDSWGIVRNRPIRDIGPVGYDVGRGFWLHDAMYKSGPWSSFADLIGITELRRAEEFFYPSCQAKNRLIQDEGSKRKGSGPSKRLFPKNSEQEALCIPHFDLPGRIIGFTFGVEQSNPNKPFPYDSYSFRTIYKRCNLGRSNVRVRESGFGFLNAIDGRRCEQFKDTVFVFVDAVIAVRIHAKQKKWSSAKLPVLFATTTSGVGNLRRPPSLQDKQIIVCGELEKTIPIARRIDADVSLYQPKDIGQELQKPYGSPTILLNEYRLEATDWWSALVASINKMDRADAQGLIEQLGV